MKTLIFFIIALLAIAIKTGQATPGEIYVTFLATPVDLPKSPGHAFACLEVKTDSSVKEECFGFYPKSMVDILNGEGVVEKELSRKETPDRFSKVTVSLQHKINEQIRKDIFAEIQKWSGLDYNIVTKNCGDMVFAVAKVAGLSTPHRSTVFTPIEFVSELRNRYWRGQWISSDSNSRFSLMLDGEEKIRWTERTKDGSSITKTVPFTPNNSEAVIKRENTEDILVFLGFQPSLRNEILSANPNPSFLKIRRQGNVIEAEWHGLVAIKDTSAHLKELKQPGTTPAKIYTFDRIH